MTADELARILDELGRRLGPAGEYAFGIAVRYQMTSALIWAIGAGVTLALIIGVVLWAARFTSRRWHADWAAYHERFPNGSTYRSDRPDSLDYLMPWMLGSLGIVLVGGGAAGTLLSSLVTVLNPEYAALRDLIGAVRR